MYILYKIADIDFLFCKTDVPGAFYLYRVLIAEIYFMHYRPSRFIGTS
jgi:hypothetical protein